MTDDEKRALRDAINGNQHLFSARHNRDYETMAIEVNQVLSDADKVTPLECHEALQFVDPPTA